MNGQYLGGRPITLSYAFKKDGQKGERHGSAAERRLADLGKKHNVLITGFVPASLPTLPNFPPPPVPQGFQATGTAPASGPPTGPPPPTGQYPPAAPPGFPNAVAGQPAGFGPPPGMPPPPAGFNQFGR